MVILFAFTIAVVSAETPPSVAATFAAGEEALRSGNLSAARQAFGEVLAADPANAAAHANLGIVCMRRREWASALSELQRAAALAPQVPEIRLNIGLIYFRQADYAHAVPAFESVVKDNPEREQSRYLLGLSYFLLDRYPECARALEKLWPSNNGDLNYLYVVMVAAGKAGRQNLANQAAERLWKVGANSAELRLFWGMALLARGQDAEALDQFQKAAQSRPRLQFLHYYLGLTYLRQHRLDEARHHFLLDRDLEPEVAYNYDELGVISLALGDLQSAKVSFQEALSRDANLSTSWFGLAKVYRREKRFPEAFTALTNAERISPESSSVHYLLGATLTTMNKPAEARKEFQVAHDLQRRGEDNLEQAMSGRSYRDVQVTSRQ